MGTKATGAQHGMSYVAESVFGTTPNTPSMKTLRHNATTLNLGKADLVPGETRADGQIAYQAAGNQAVAGSIEAEFVYGDHDDFLAAVMRSTWASNILKSGTGQPSFSIERRFTDISKYILFKGCVIDTAQIGIQQSAEGLFANVSFGVLGREAVPGGTSAGTPAAAATGVAPFVSFKGSIEEGGSPIAIVTGVTLNIANGYAVRPVVGSPLTVEQSRRRMEVTGTVTCYFEDLVMLSKFINETESSLALTLEDTAGNELEISAPRIKYTGGDVPRSGDDDIILTMPFRALYHTGSASPLVFTRAAA